MRVGYIVGALGSGGSERQLSILAAGMRARGHDVEVCCYDGPGFYDSPLREKGVAVRTETGANKIEKLRLVRRWLEAFEPQVLHAFMKRASSLAVLAAVGRKGPRIIASDLSTATYAPRRPSLWASLVLFRWADCVATQTEMNKASLERLAPFLKGKVRVLRNGVDTVRFERRPLPGVEPVMLLVVGSVTKVKNPLRLIRALHVVRQRSEVPFRVTWVGRTGLGGKNPETSEFAKARALMDDLGVTDILTFAGETRDVESAYHAADALVHVSVQEGIPNAVVEAMACGLPLVVSRVSDLPLIVEDGRNAFLCDADDEESIANAIERLLARSNEERMSMGLVSRQLAERLFGLDRFIGEYEEVYTELIGPFAEAQGRPVRSGGEPASPGRP